MTAMDTGLLKYIGRRFEDDTGAEETSHTIVAGWTRRLSAFTTVTVQAGPRLHDDKADAEVLASVQHRLKSADRASRPRWLRENVELVEEALR